MSASTDDVRNWREMVRADARDLAKAERKAARIRGLLGFDLKAARRHGATLGELAADAGLSPQRVGQITHE